jgi:hypothetical protein
MRSGPGGVVSLTGGNDPDERVAQGRGRPVYVRDQGFCQTVGIPLDELIGKTDFVLFPTALAEGYRQGDLKILTTGTTYEAIEEVIDAKASGGAYRSSSCPFRMDRATSSARRESSGRYRRRAKPRRVSCAASSPKPS